MNKTGAVGSSPGPGDTVPPTWVSVGAARAGRAAHGHTPFSGAPFCAGAAVRGARGRGGVNWGSRPGDLGAWPDATSSAVLSGSPLSRRGGAIRGRGGAGPGYLGRDAAVLSLQGLARSRGATRKGWTRQRLSLGQKNSLSGRPFARAPAARMGRKVTVATCALNQWALDFEGNLQRILKSESGGGWGGGLEVRSGRPGLLVALRQFCSGESRPGRGDR